MQRVSDREISVTSRSPSSKGTRELEDAEEEESCECRLPMESGEMGNSQSVDHCRLFPRVQTTQA